MHFHLTSLQFLLEELLLFNLFPFRRLLKTLIQESREQDLFYLIWIHDLIAIELIVDLLFYNSYLSIFDVSIKVLLIVSLVHYYSQVLFVLKILIDVIVIFFYLLSFRHLSYYVSSI